MLFRFIDRVFYQLNNWSYRACTMLVAVVVEINICNFWALKPREKFPLDVGSSSCDFYYNFYPHPPLHLPLSIVMIVRRCMHGFLGLDCFGFRPQEFHLLIFGNYIN